MAAREWTCKEASTAVQSKIPILKQEFEGHEREIWSFVFLHDNIHIVSGSVDGTMRKWNCNTGLVVGEPWKGEEGRIHALVLSPDGMIIVCGRMDGSIQRWTTDGKRIKGAWTGHSKWVRSLSWSPSGSHFASGSDDGTILIRTADNGKVVVGPIDTKQSSVSSLAYSPSGERIASGGHNKTICIWNTKTGKLVIGPMEGLEHHVTSLAWSSDGTKVYSASDEFARVFDSTSGALLHSFKHDSCLYSVALSPKDNVLACVGINGVAQLWDIESNQQLGEPIHQNHRDDTLYCVSFSRDGRYLAYGGDNNKLTLWIVKDTVLRLPAPTPPEQSDGQSTQQETPNSPSSCLDVDATGGAGFIEEAQGDLDNNFFHLPQEFLPSPSPGLHFHSFLLARRFLNVISRRRPPSDESVPQERSKHSFFSRRARSNSFVQLAAIKPNQLVPEGKVTEGERGKSVDDVSAVSTLAQCHLSTTALSVILRMIRSAPEKIESYGVPPLTSIGKIIGTAGHGYCSLEEKIIHLVSSIPALQDLPDILSMFFLLARMIDTASSLRLTRKRLQLCYARMTM
ncbi:WD40-repeat-containing domain protein [Suillus discolor]|uniref:WD40-repeat-containing domain protein n=1 Tax=Suillus discolor TaxID=1912936 RepID=A0A9P7F618_9AGAM|nr:WD40-repeat-containing domain protein [Suillus discolor]KAG2106586.1 WD40-repeat-containing domain protein [Suillus discolor]